MKSKLCAALVTLMAVFSTSVFAANLASPVGYWKTIDDVTGKPKGIVRITETSSHLLQGSIVKIFPRPGVDEHELCSKCKGSKHNQPILGMQVLTNLHPDPDDATRWEKGKILDPHNGKVYNCNIQLIDNNRKLSVRGYIGISMFGRSQTWLRVNGAGG